MDKDRIKGKADEIAGRVKRQAGEWGGNKDLEAEGTKQQVKGKVESAVGKAKDAARNVKEDLKRNRDRDQEKKEDAA